MRFQKLSDVCEIIMGQSPDSSSYNENKEGMPFYQGKTDFGEIHPIPRMYCSKPSKVAIVNDILMSVRAPVGDVNIATEECCIGRGIAALRSKEGIYYKYLFYVLEFMKERIANLGTGSTFKAISKAPLSSVEIPVPSIERQMKIVEIIEKVKDVLNKRQSQITALEELRRSLFLEMFGDPIVNSNAYPIIKFKDIIADIRYGTSTPPQFSNEGFKFIRATNVNSGEITENSMLYISSEEAVKISKCLLQENEMIFVRSGVNSGDNALVTKEYAGHYGGYDIIVNYDIKKANPVYLNAYFNSEFLQLCIKPLTRRAAQPHLNKEQIKNLDVIVPPIELQEKFSNKLLEISKQKQLLVTSKSELHNLYNSLLQKAFNGELFRD